ncbi:hypothetical protein NWF32_16905 [Pseudomonas qingdaonensis]|nr:hypothetical protein [Pseudomonas qingdaonensis]
MCGSVFLLGSEAGLPVERQQQLAGMTQAEHRPLTDWRYPEFASRTPGYVLDSLRNEQAEALQAFYLSDSGGDQAALRDRLATLPTPRPKPPAHAAHCRPTCSPASTNGNSRAMPRCGCSIAGASAAGPSCPFPCPRSNCSTCSALLLCPSRTTP